MNFMEWLTETEEGRMVSFLPMREAVEIAFRAGVQSVRSQMKFVSVAPVKTIGDRVREVCAAADKDGADRVLYVQDLMLEKDCICSRRYAEWMIQKHVKPDAEKLEMVKGQLNCDPAEFED